MQLDTDEIVKEGAALEKKAEGGLKFLWRMTGLVPYLRIALLILVIGVVIYLTQCGTSKTEEHIGQQNNQTVETTAKETQADTKATEAETTEKEKEKVVVEADRTAKEKVADAKKARNANTTNTSYSEANRQRCLTYPESAECK